MMPAGALTWSWVVRWHWHFLTGRELAAVCVNAHVERSKKRKRAGCEPEGDMVEAGSGPWGAPDVSQSQELPSAPMVAAAPAGGAVATSLSSGALMIDHLATVGCGSGAMQQAHKIVRDPGLLCIDDGAFEPLIKGSVDNVSVFKFRTD